MRTLLLFVTVVLLAGECYAQQIYQIRADSVRIYNICDTAELIIENRTQGTQGFLYNKGAGRTEFRRVRLEKIGDSKIAITRQDTIDLRTLSGIGGIENIFRQGDDIIYVKNGQQFNVYAPVPGFVNVPNAGASGPAEFVNGRVVGFDAYDSPDMPLVSDQALRNPTTERKYYSGHAVLLNGRGYQMAVNWDGEETGAKGIFIRNKDDTTPGWGAWRELLFKDYADRKYILKSEVSDSCIKNGSVLETATFNIQGKGNITNDYVFDNSAYAAGNLELRSANNPGMGFHRPGVLGRSLYSDWELSLKARGAGAGRYFLALD